MSSPATNAGAAMIAITKIPETTIVPSKSCGDRLKIIATHMSAIATLAEIASQPNTRIALISTCAT